MIKKGQPEVSQMDSPEQGGHRDPDAPKIKRKGGSGSPTSADGSGAGEVGPASPSS